MMRLNYHQVPTCTLCVIIQVFEAYTDEDHLEQRDYSWEQPLTAEDKVILIICINVYRDVYTAIALNTHKLYCNPSTIR